jgi:hypothetical protein
MITIKVTQKDINEGQRVNGYGCAVALGVKRVLGEVDFHVNTRHIIIGEAHFDLPEHVIDFIKRFDNCERVRPTSFTLPLAVKKAKKTIRIKRQPKQEAVLV